MDECVGCSYMYKKDDEKEPRCHFIEDEPSLAKALIDCIETYRELQEDMY